MVPSLAGVSARTGTAARGAWNYLGISLERRLGTVVQWGKAAGPGGWVEQPGRVGAMVAEAGAAGTELAGVGILGAPGGWRAGCAGPLGGPRPRGGLGL